MSLSFDHSTQLTGQSTEVKDYIAGMEIIYNQAAVLSLFNSCLLPGSIESERIHEITVKLLDQFSSITERMRMHLSSEAPDTFSEVRSEQPGDVPMALGDQRHGQTRHNLPGLYQQ